MSRFLLAFCQCKDSVSRPWQYFFEPSKMFWVG